MQSVLAHVSTQALTNFCKQYQVRELSLSGSAERGEVRPDSDLNILVAFEVHQNSGFCHDCGTFYSRRSRNYGF